VHGVSIAALFTTEKPLRRDGAFLRALSRISKAPSFSVDPF
jgi:hypothetical protein